MFEFNDPIFNINKNCNNDSADRTVNEHNVKVPDDPISNSILDQAPPYNKAGNAEQFGSVGVYGISIQGRSHVIRNQCCQDYNSFWYLPDENIWILAIADGVGSCSLSHWGAYTAVSKVIEFLRYRLCSESVSASHAKHLTNYTLEEIESIFNDAFTFAQKEVENFADTNQQPVFNFQSTLTVALYDGQLLYCCHVGDDGIVAEGVSGKYQMVTDRVKGNEANSVYTLQSGCWSVRRVNNVVALVMSTDGILDSYVGNAFTNNRVYYPFFHNLTYSMKVLSGESPKTAVKKASELAIIELTQKAVNGVSDDMTVLVAANQEMLDRPTQPQFSQEAWDQETEQLRKKQYDMLYRSSVTPKFSSFIDDSDDRKTKHSIEEKKLDFHKRTADIQSGSSNKKTKIMISSIDQATVKNPKSFFKMTMMKYGYKIVVYVSNALSNMNMDDINFQKNILICPECGVRYLGFSKCPNCKVKLISEE